MATATTVNLSTYDGAADDVLAITDCSDNAYRLANLVTLDCRYVFSVWTKAESEMTVRFSVLGSVFTASVTTEWQRLIYIVSSISTSYIDICPESDAALYLYKGQLETGSIATDWTPAPEDTETTITTIQDQYATVTQTISGIETEIGDLTTVVGDNYTALDSKITTVSETADSISATVSSNYTALSAADTKYGTCSTGASTKAKVVTCSSFTTLSAGATICVYFTYANTVASPTLNVNSTGAKTIYAYGAAIASDSDYNWVEKSYVTFVYNGSQWCMVDAGSHSKIAALQVTADSITASVSTLQSTVTDQGTSITTITGELALKVDKDDNDQIVSMLNASADVITLTSNRLVITSDNFALTAEGVITATGGTIGGWQISGSKIYSTGTDGLVAAMQAPGGGDGTATYVFAAGGTSHESYSDCPFRVTRAGNVTTGSIHASGNVYVGNDVPVPEVQRGTVSITPASTTTPTGKAVSFDVEFSGTPAVTISANTSVVGTTVTGWGTAGRSSTGFTAYVLRSNTTSTDLCWIAAYN